MYEIGICDDGENTCASIEAKLLCYARKKNIQIEVQVWYTGEGLKDYLEQGGHLDVLFLDIELFQMTGIEVGSYIRNVMDDMRMQIIYISWKASYALELFQTQPIDFLVKPIQQEHIDRVMDTAIKIIKKRNERFEFRQGKDQYYLPVGDILYLESSGRKVKLMTTKGTFEIYGRLKEIVKGLPEDFLMIHQSYVVNREYVVRYSYESVELKGGVVLAVSKANRKQVRERLMRDGE